MTKLLATAATMAALAGALYLVPTDTVATRTQFLDFASPLPLDPSPALPAAADLLALLNALQDPNVSFVDKSHLVEGGISPVEAHLADARMKQAVAHGELPLTAAVANIQPAGPDQASADVTISGPKLTPVTQKLTFIKQGDWKITRASAVSLLEESGAARS
ncbi:MULTISPECIES: hypothetical protein [Mycobacterium]|uniref:Low molecular weight antigen MTB12-like C-terminal domain-containing protein n=1 Tax=Mycobacterium kiyosense TaxID=2871094 RepID=A0A9P3UVS0_9MYCO|nr:MULTISPECIES: hypothetical protein [Mycobacterium]BDB42883.1 hypothetical protein IWGMT90018_33290 [Mycobacterium kiyosense]BDE13883.1 hypothetical protein MKCMC460_27430 [Mycobacterium sp. 20KCMC460]GLB83772.1 hypothetical protein SRL2020028_30280 [Mycobacterium kiyosense]GLB91345.1 hypothetical protein SRL2020130_41620 [Mycobacterium kiyosense]GLB97220.1 hypothetical protein SRL2020226_39960 [Mycobacterium kiyosense]